MTKYVARVAEVLRSGSHGVTTLEEGEVVPVADLPLPSRVEIHLEGGREDPCTMLRYTDADEFCGDTWHECLEDAFSQAEFEYGLSESDFEEVEEAIG